jgi:DNA-binding MarR family transcriptional regulator
MSVQVSAFVPCQRCVCSALRRASRAVTQHFEASFRGTGLRVTQFTLLATLIQTGPLPTSALAGRLGLERTTLTRNLQLLEKKGLVAVAGDEDRRVRRIAVTRKGEAAAAAALPAWKRAQASTGVVLRRSGVGVLPGAQAD